MPFTKDSPADLPEAALAEAAGLRWLAEPVPAGGAPVAQVLSAEPGELVLEHIPTTAPDAAAARRFGEQLARTHRSLPEQAAFGALPEGHPAGTGPLFGPAEQLLELGGGTHDSWGAFHAGERLGPILDRLRGSVSSEDWQLLERARATIAAGDFDDDEPPARIHGDLWSGNVLWRAEPGGVTGVLIDPAAHAGHREDDLAMLHLFGLPHLDEAMDGYQEMAPLRPGWRDRIPVRQLFFLAVHWLLFGPAYAPATRAAAAHTLAL